MIQRLCAMLHAAQNRAGWDGPSSSHDEQYIVIGAEELETWVDLADAVARGHSSLLPSHLGVDDQARKYALEALGKAANNARRIDALERNQERLRSAICPPCDVPAE